MLHPLFNYGPVYAPIFNDIEYYMYMEATDVSPGTRCVLISPIIPNYELSKCLTFQYNVYGKHSGTLIVADENYEPVRTIRPGTMAMSLFLPKNMF